MCTTKLTKMTNKEIAIDFLMLASKRRAREAFGKYVGDGFKHHNVYFKGDAETLIGAIDDNAAQSPDKIFDVKRALEDGNLVAVHSHIRQNPKDLGAAVMHIFQFSGNKIVEMWDFGQAVPVKTVNENGLF